MKNFNFLFLSFLSFLFFAFVFTKEKKQDEVFTTENSLLWKIEHPKTKKISHLFGTMHLIQKEFFYLPKIISEKLKKSDVLLTEIQLNELNNQAKTLALLTLKDETFFDYFTKYQQDSILNWVSLKMNLNEDMFQATFGKFKPFVFVQTITQMAFFGKTESYELSLKEIADKNKIKLEGLEKIEEQLAFFDNMSREDQAEMIMESIRNEEESIQTLKKLQKHYRNQALDSLLYLMQSEKGVVGKHEQTLLVNRNVNWLPKIDLLCENKSVFVAVGAAHLLGEKGLIQLLKSRGFKLTPIKI